MWFDPTDIINKQRLFNFIIGARGCGKTYGTIKYIIKRKLKDPDFEAVWVRRFRGERKTIKPTFFDSILSHDEFPGHELTIADGNKGLLDGNTLVWFSALSTDGRVKGITSPNVQMIVFDEFLLLPPAHYLPDEVNVFLGLYDSIARPADPTRKRVPVLFYANATTEVNPYFVFFGIKLDINGRFKNKSIYAERYTDESYKQQAKQSEFAQLIANTQYAEHSIDNEFMFDNMKFVEKRSESAKYFVTLLFAGGKYGIWADWNSGKMYISDKLDPSCRYTYAITNEDAVPNAITIKAFKKTFHYEMIKAAFNVSSFYAENQKLKSDWYKIVKLIMI